MKHLMLTICIEDADSVKTVQETGPTLTRPKQIKTPEQLFGNDATR